MTAVPSNPQSQGGPDDVTPNVAPPSHFLTAIRFLFVGGFNSLLHAAVVLGLGLLLPTWHGFVLIMIAWVICIPIGYVTQAKIVWRARLTGAGLLKISISQIPSATISTLLGALGGALGFPLIAQEGMALVSGAIMSYVLQRFWVFREPVPAIDEPPTAD